MFHQMPAQKKSRAIKNSKNCVVNVPGNRYDKRKGEYFNGGSIS